MKIYGLFILFTAFYSFQSSGQVNWNTTIDSANVFSSPRFSDLNGDGHLDVIFGGGIEDIPSSNGIVALNGKTGELIWRVPTKTQVYTSPLLMDINKDGIEDVFIGGRDAIFMCIDGRSGTTLWDFNVSNRIDVPRKSGWLNFFATQFTVDLNKDGYNDLLVTNGGDYLAGPRQKKRPTARLMVICSKTGSILLDQGIPEARESYYAPHTFKDSRNEEFIVFGTGGETVDGGVWMIKLSDFLSKKMNSSVKILEDKNKGIILNSIVTDFNNDEKADLFVSHMDGRLTAMEVTGSTLWSIAFPGYECYVTPSLGYLNQDNTPDVFTILAEGSFPAYTSFKLVGIDGRTGEILFEENNGFNQFSPAVCADLNKDGTDEIIYVHNTLLDPTSYIISNQIRIIDIKNAQTYFIGDVKLGVSMASSPSLTDLDQDGDPELVVITSSFPNEKGIYSSKAVSMELDHAPSQITWPGYLGPQENGYFFKR
jgi:outer membrane protein assembly factor BamB